MPTLNRLFVNVKKDPLRPTLSILKLHKCEFVYILRTNKYSCYDVAPSERVTL